MPRAEEINLTDGRIVFKCLWEVAHNALTARSNCLDNNRLSCRGKLV